MSRVIVNKRMGYGGQVAALRDFSEPLITQKETTSYGERILSTIDLGETVPAIYDLAKRLREYIKIWRNMAKSPYIDFAIEDIVNEMLSIDDTDVFPIDIDLSNTKFSEKIRNMIHDEWQYILKLMEFHTKSYTYIRDWYIDGIAYYYVEYDSKSKKGIKSITPLDPLRTQKFIEYKNGEEVVTYVYQDIDLSQTLLEIPENQMIELNSGLMDELHQIWISFLQKAYIPLNQLSSIEDSLVIYRLSRAPERRVFYVDVGELPKSKAEAYMKELVRNYRNKMEYDKNTGTIKEQVRHSSLLEDIWLPRRGGSTGTEVSTLAGHTSFLQNLDDIDYFVKKLFRALNVPISRFRNEEGAANVIGRTTEVTRDELKYTKFINRLRHSFNPLFFILIKIQLHLKGIVKDHEFQDERENVNFIWNSDSMFSEFKNMDVLTERMSTLETLMPYVGKLFSLQYLRREILKQTDEDIKQMDKEIAKEKSQYVEMGIYPSGEDKDGEPDYNKSFTPKFGE